MTAKKKDPGTMLTARVPTSLIKALDKAAERQRRSRSAELVVRLEASLKAQPEQVAA